MIHSFIQSINQSIKQTNMADPVMPLQFVYSRQDFVTDVRRRSENHHALAPLHTKFDTTVRVGWTDRMDRGLFRYHLDPSCCFPQILTRSAVQVGIESVLLSSDPGFRVGFNSLGAFASVNHLHLHGYYLDHELTIESMPVKPVVSEKGFYRMQDFPAGFLFYTESDEVEKVARTICQVTDFLVDDNIAHNLFLTRGCPPCGCIQSKKDRCLRNGVRIAIWPRTACFGAKEESAFNVALCELAGHLPFKNKKDYDFTTERDVISTVQRYLLSDDEFDRLEQQLSSHLLAS
ncbi:GDP-D-glucose phosphorylase 1 isoform 4-T4 [Odontesthes bonariensis]